MGLSPLRGSQPTIFCCAWAFVTFVPDGQHLEIAGTQFFGVLGHWIVTVPVWVRGPPRNNNFDNKNDDEH